MRRIPWRGLKRTLVTGLFIVAPVSLTFLLLAWFVSLVDGLLEPVTAFTGRPIPGLGLVVAFVIVLAAGVLGSNLVGQQLLELTEELLLKIPVFNWIYRTIKQLSEVFSPAGRANFKSVVLVEYPRPGVYSIGFVTNQIALESPEGSKPLAAVYVPTNHMYMGDIVLVPAESVIYTKMSQQEGIQAVISAGAALPQILKASGQKP
jgi:uncharacterized membrane protein